MYVAGCSCQVHDMSRFQRSRSPRVREFSLRYMPRRSRDGASSSGSERAARLFFFSMMSQCAMVVLTRSAEGNAAIHVAACQKANSMLMALRVLLLYAPSSANRSARG